MNEKLQKRIEEKVKTKHCSNSCPFESIRYCKECVIKKDAVEMAIFALQNQWISAEEALPVLVDKKSGQSEVVLAMADYDRVFTAYYDYSNEHWYYNNYNGFDPQVYCEVIHWMPIPKMKEE